MWEAVGGEKLNSMSGWYMMLFSTVSVLAACITVCPCSLMLCVPRHIFAAGDYGSALALGAHGVAQDIEEGEKYLQIATAGGDVASQRNYGMLLLQLNRAAEAAEQLSAASGT